MTIPIVALAALMLGIAASDVDAQGRGNGKADRGAPGSNAKDTRPGTDVEIRIIRDYYSVQSRKTKSLPPGIARNLARGKPLPPGIAKTRVPDDLIVLLPARSGARWLIAGDVVLLVDASDIIVDLVRLVF